MRWVKPASLSRACPTGVFTHPTWQRHRPSPGSYRVLELVDAGRRLAVLALTEVDVPGLYRRWCVLSEPEPVGGVALDHGLSLEALITAAKAAQVDRLDCWSNMARWRKAEVLPILEAHGAELDDFGTYVLPTAADPEAVLARFGKNHRNAVRRAQKDGLTLGPVSGEAFVALMRVTYERGGKSLPFSEPYLKSLFDAPKVPLVIKAAWLGERLEAAVVIPFDRRRAYFLHGASAPDASLGAAPLAHHAAIQALAEAGCPLYDLGGARLATEDRRLKGISDFKRRFGGDFEPVLRWRLNLTRRARLIHEQAPAAQSALERLWKRARPSR